MPLLKIDWATAEAARFACERWHYSGCKPVFKCVQLGVWEDGKFIGVVMFGNGANRNLGTPYGLTQFECAELTRIALTKHKTPVSRIMAICLRMLKKQSPGLRMVISYADAGQGHVGGIYQATNWIYTGGASTHAFVVKGEQYHPKTLHTRYGNGGQSLPWLRANVDPKARKVITGFKHRYLMPLDDDMRKRVMQYSQPYPKRDKIASTASEQ